MEGNLRLFINSLDNHCASASASDVGIISASMENAINIFHLLYLYWNIRESCFEIVDFCNFIGLLRKLWLTRGGALRSNVPSIIIRS